MGTTGRTNHLISRRRTLPITQPGKRASTTQRHVVLRDLMDRIGQLWEWSVLVAVTTWRPCERFRPDLPDRSAEAFAFARLRLI
jgi:hypothetical protein